MSQSREKIELDKDVARELTSKWGNKRGAEFGYEHAQDIITSSDPEDGGADHILIIKRLSDGKYFRKYYSDWDIDYNYDRDWDGCFEEVFPRQITTTIFE